MHVSQTPIFKKWFDKLKDRQGQSHILVRIGRLERGNFGDVKPVGEGVSELRIHIGAGYRLYLCQRDADWLILLCGGNKAGQSRDIEQAKLLAKQLRQTDWDLSDDD